jgi:hypothetical protein
MNSTLQSRNQELGAHYEQLRRDAVSLSAGDRPMPGLALLLRQGLTAWMRAWSPCISQEEAKIVLPSPAHQPSPETKNDDFCHPLELRSQIVTLLAGMIMLSQQLEVVS